MPKPLKPEVVELRLQALIDRLERHVLKARQFERQLSGDGYEGPAKAIADTAGWIDQAIDRLTEEVGAAL